MRIQSTLPAGYEYRGLVCRAYPTQLQLQSIASLQPSLRSAWNWLCSRVESVLQARDARATRLGLVPALIPRPKYDGMAPDIAKAAKAEYIQACTDRRKAIASAVDKLPECTWRPHLTGADSEATRLGLKHDYQVINNYLAHKELPELPAAMAQSLYKNWATNTGGKRKKVRKGHEWMPMQVRSGDKLRLRTNDPRCNGEVKLPTVGWVGVRLDPGLVRLLLTPGVAALEGVTLRRDSAGRWYASVKLQRRIPGRSGPRDGSVLGIDPGLADLVTSSDGHKIRNPRNLKFVDAESVALSIISRIADPITREDMRIAVYRHSARVDRRAQTQLQQFVAMVAKTYDVVAVECNTGIALGLGSRYRGMTKTLVALLTDKMGASRVREVESYHNSQDCSQCGHRDKLAWSRKLGQADQTCICPVCGYTDDRDRNAARNVRRKYMMSIQPSYPCYNTSRTGDKP